MHNVKSKTKEAPPEFPSTGLRPNNNIAQSLLFHPAPGRLLKEEDWGNECNEEWGPVSHVFTEALA